MPSGIVKTISMVTISPIATGGLPFKLVSAVLASEVATMFLRTPARGTGRLALSSSVVVRSTPEGGTPS